MKKLINKSIIILLILSLQSCGVFSSVFKKSDKYKDKSEISVTKDISNNTLDKSLIVIKETVDSTIKTDFKKFETSNLLNNIVDIKNLTILSNDLLEVKQNYDTLHKSLSTEVVLKSRNIPVKVNKTTTINKDVFVNTNIKIDSISKKDIINKSSIKTKEPKNTFWFTILLSGVAIGLFFGLKKIFQKKLL